MDSRVGIVATAVIVVSFSSWAAPPMKWSKKMLEMKSALSVLMPALSSDEQFKSPQNQKKIEQSIKTLARLSHDVGEQAIQTELPDADLSLPMIASLFQAETDRAYREYKKGRKEYARSLLRGIPTFCIACHTRTQGVDLSKTLMDQTASSLSGIEKAQMYAAARQFDLALSEYEAIILGPQGPKVRSIEWEKSVRRALTILVRVKRDPIRALAIVERVLTASDAPLFLREDAKKWKQALLAWKSKSPEEAPANEEDAYKKARALFDQALEAQRYPADRSAEMLYLRLSAAAHDLLAKYPQGKHAADGLYLLGTSYEALQDLELWTLHELYYEACIRKAPQTEASKECYRRYEQSVYQGFSGSAGTSIPDDVQSKLNELKKTAFGETRSTP